MTALPLLVLLSLAQTPVSAPDAAERAAAAAERSAAAAERAAAAVERAARALELSSVPGAAAAPAAPAAAAAPPAWNGSVGVALIALSGNASSLTFNANAALERKWENWTVGFKATGTYGQSQVEGQADPQIIAMAAGLQGRVERKVLGPATAFVGAGGETNHVKSVEFLGFAEPGLSITWLDRKEGDYQKALFKTELSLRYARELQHQYYPTPADLPDRDVLGPRVGVGFQYAVSKDIVVFENAELIASLVGEPRLLLASTTKLSARLTESLAISLSFALTRDSAPAPGKVPMDTALTVGLDYTI